MLVSFLSFNRANRSRSLCGVTYTQPAFFNSLPSGKIRPAASNSLWAFFSATNIASRLPLLSPLLLLLLLSIFDLASSVFDIVNSINHHQISMKQDDQN